MTTCAECSIKVVEYLLTVMHSKLLALPGEIPLQLISSETGFTPQLIGLAFPKVKEALFLNGYLVEKSGNPKSLKITKNS